MKSDKFKLSLLISAVAVALLDIAYIIFLALQITTVSAGIGALHYRFRDLSIGVIVVNAALLCYTIFYLIFRKR